MYLTHPAYLHAKHRVAGDRLEVRVVRQVIPPLLFRLGKRPWTRLAVTPRASRMKFMSRWLRRMADRGVRPSGPLLSRPLACWRASLPAEYGRPTTPAISTFPGLRERVLAAEARRIR